MSSAGKKPIIGILGGIGSGKSSAAGEFAKLGCGVIDADKIAHELLEEKNVEQEVVSVFGDSILNADGKIDRGKLAAVVFCDGQKLSKLNSILHPGVLARSEELIERYNGDANVRAIVLDMPLMTEVGWDKRCERIVFVACSEQLRVERAKQLGVFGENELKNREKFQISLDTKIAIADNTIDNNSDFSELVRQVTEIFSSIMDNG